MSNVLETFCELVQIDSESGEEAAVISCLKELFERELDAECILDSYGNLIAHVAGNDSASADSIMLVSHADTVKPGRGIEPVIRDGVIHSAGETILGADDKAGISMIFEAMQTAVRHPPVEIVITRNEEVGLLGSKNLDLSILRSKMAFIMDGENMEAITIGGPTLISLGIDITGRAAHMEEIEKGISAIRVAAEAIYTMPEGRIDNETTANVGIIQGGIVTNGVPEKVTIKAECRSIDHDKCMCQSEAMQKAFKAAARKAGAKIDIKVNLENRGSRLSEDSLAVQSAKSAISAAGLEPRTRIGGGGSDALVLMQRGLDAVAIGCGIRAAHSTREFIEVSKLEQGAEIVRQLLYAA